MICRIIQQTWLKLRMQPSASLTGSLPAAASSACSSGLGLMFQTWNSSRLCWAASMPRSGCTSSRAWSSPYRSSTPTSCGRRTAYFEADDGKWIMNGGGYLWPTKNLPPVYKYNAGQKAFFWCIMAFGSSSSYPGS